MSTNITVEKFILWALSLISPAGLIYIGIAYGEQTTIVQQLQDESSSTAAAIVRSHKNEEKVHNLITQQAGVQEELKEQRAILRQILMGVNSIRRD